MYRVLDVASVIVVSFEKLSAGWISRGSSPDLATNHVDNGNAACAVCTLTLTGQLFTELFLKCQNVCLTLNVLHFFSMSCILYKR